MIYVSFNRNVKPDYPNIYAMDLYPDEYEEFARPYIDRCKNESFVVNSPFLLDYLPKDYLIFVDKDGTRYKWSEYFKSGKPSENYVNAITPKKLGSEHFSAEELMCHGASQGHCNCGVETAGKVSPRLLELLEQLRYNIGGTPIKISCAYRCPAHNRHPDIGGVENSQHVYGTAADVQFPSYMDEGAFKWHAEQLPFDGIGYYDWGLHVDTRSGGIGERVIW